MRKTVSIETHTDEHGNKSIQMFIMSDFSIDVDWLPEPGSDARKRLDIPDNRLVVPSIMGRVEQERQRLLTILEQQCVKAARLGKPLMFHLEGNRLCTHVTSLKHRSVAEPRILEYDEFMRKAIESQCHSCHSYASKLEKQYKR